MGLAAVRVRLEVNDVEGGVLLRASGARRFAFNWAVAKIQANHAEWAAQRDAGIAPADRVRPLSFFTLAKVWTAEKPEVAPWAGDHSTWTFRYAIRSAAEAHRAFLEGKRRFPRFRVRVAKYGWFRIAAPCRAQTRLRRLVRRGRARLMNMTVTRHSDGRWYATTCFERHETTVPAQRTAPAGPVVGIDRGIKVNAVLAAWGETRLGTDQDGDRHPGGPTAGTCRHACGGSNEPPPNPGAAGAPDEPGTSPPLTRVA